MEKQTVNYDLGYSDHLAQIMYPKVGTLTLHPTAVQKRQFTNTAVEGFIYFLQQETWDEVLSTEDVNLAYSAFMTTYMHHFNARFPAKTCHLPGNKKVKWVMKGLIVSKNRMRFLNGLKRSKNTPVEVPQYINKYNAVCKNLVKEAKK